MDRDYAAGLELSRRVKKSRSKKVVKSGVLKQRSCRDKHSPTPKRPKTMKRKFVLKSVKNNVSGVPIAVVSSAETRLKTTISELSESYASYDYYTKILQS